ELTKNNYDGKQLLEEINSIFPGVQSISISRNTFYFDKDSTNESTVIIYQVQKELKKEEKLKLENWLTKRLSLERLELIRK
ncbi:MAG TPA: hypothetical protein PLQ93_06655, partial [Bacteroidia bacterium]|nr:hypothetical protein [Bacteroidia bacterium]